MTDRLRLSLPLKVCSLHCLSVKKQTDTKYAM